MNYFNWYDKKLILASKSPRREEILKIFKPDFSICPSNYIEKNDGDLSPKELVKSHACHKAKDVASDHTKSWILGADTIVVKDEKILGKPKNRQDAIEMLTFLSDSTHRVLTGYCLLNSDNNKYLINSVTTEVVFRKISLSTINYYIDNFNPYDKAGSYAIQDFSAIFVKKINGCFYNVVGFPLPEFMNHIKNELHTCLS